MKILCCTLNGTVVPHKETSLHMQTTNKSACTSGYLIRVFNAVRKKDVLIMHNST